MSRAPGRARPARRLRVVVTAGPTREHLDPVRYLTNESSGKMGFALAARAAARGHAVTLIAGPVALQTPPGVRRIDVVDARELLAALRREFRSADALYMAAAVCDWRPARRLAGKWRAKDEAAERTRVELVRNPDVLATVAGARGARDQRIVVGFALETGDGIRRARRKLEAKGADWIVLNDASALHASKVSVTILGKDGSLVKIPRRPKEAVADRLLDLLERVPGQ
jgi:phosphopantothenoylcysteine decarboxylase/phosphopantothenate--cysteine ligase